jgi:hypothetical protein
MGKVRRTSGGSWVRHGAGVLSDGTPEYMFIVGPDDRSPYTPSSEYRSECGLCYLGAPHSVALHETRG